MKLLSSAKSSFHTRFLKGFYVNKAQTPWEDNHPTVLSSTSLISYKAFYKKSIKKVVEKLHALKKEYENRITEIDDIKDMYTKRLDKIIKSPDVMDLWVLLFCNAFFDWENLNRRK